VALSVAMTSWAILIALLIGMEKPTPILPAVVPGDVPPPGDAIATLTPMISPCVFTRGPPELPGLICRLGLELIETDVAAGGREGLLVSRRVERS
jgi:hypothetical protein